MQLLAKIPFPILLLALSLNWACTKKRNNPFCYSCEKGTLFYSINCASYPLFVSETGDSFFLMGGFSKPFRKDSVRVCIKVEDHNGISNGGCGVKRVKCIRKIK